MFDFVFSLFGLPLSALFFGPALTSPRLPRDHQLILHGDRMFVPGRGPCTRVCCRDLAGLGFVWIAEIVMRDQRWTALPTRDVGNPCPRQLGTSP